MAVTTCNPGSFLELVGRFELVGADEQFALDVDSQRIIGLAELLRTFRDIPDDPVIGRIRIRIEPCYPA